MVWPTLKCYFSYEHQDSLALGITTRWSKAHQLLVEYKLQKHQIEAAVTHGDLGFRPGFVEIFKVLAAEKVPTLIFSAGLYDVIHEVLHQEFRRHGMSTTPSNVHVVSNMMQFDGKGQITGFQGSVRSCAVVV
jgi:2-hydroxy-3-keto-5-methylthiopentenyl-1-phosphate phosphatase